MVPGASSPTCTHLILKMIPARVKRVSPSIPLFREWDQLQVTELKGDSDLGLVPAHQSVASRVCPGLEGHSGDGVVGIPVPVTV